MSDNENVVIVLLPGMDGTGILFKGFVTLLPEGIDVRVVPYPEDKHLTYEQLAERAAAVVPRSAPYVIIAESYSGPVATILAARPVGNLQAVVFVSSFVAFPCGRIGSWIANLVPTALFRARTPAWILRWFLMDSATPPEMVSAVQDAISRVRPEVLTRRLRDALKADFTAMLQHCSVRFICLFSESDRLLGTRALRGFLAAKPDIETVKIAGPHFLLQCSPESSLAVLRKIGIFGSGVIERR
ncbi:MAG TPA: alpha/beta fold hydrolase [Bryobacteraceae bacterium]|nr:alpha/beta fold hydrolase [Bryobacteraceae bacterium]